MVCEVVNGDRGGGQSRRAWLGSQAAGDTHLASAPGEQPPSSMVPSILINAAEGSKLVIGGAGGELIISAVAQVNLGAPDGNDPSLGAGMGWRGWRVPLPPCIVLLSPRSS